MSFSTAQGRHPAVSSHPAVSLPEDPTVTMLWHTPHCHVQCLTSLSSLRESHLFFPFITTSLGKNYRKSQIWVENFLGKCWTRYREPAWDWPRDLSTAASCHALTAAWTQSEGPGSSKACNSLGGRERWKATKPHRSLIHAHKASSSPDMT